jgi:hypothetical protein
VKDKLFVIFGAIVICAVVFGLLANLTATLPSNISTVIETR